MKTPKGWNYTGDVSLRHGGFYWKTPEGELDDRVEAVDVFEISENVFGIVSDIIYMPRDLYRSALETCGYELNDNGFIVDCTGEVHTDTLPLLVDAFKATWGLDDSSFVFKAVIGGPKEHDCHRRLSNNASLRNFVEREFLV